MDQAQAGNPGGLKAYQEIADQDGQGQADINRYGGVLRNLPSAVFLVDRNHCVMGLNHSLDGLPQKAGAMIGQDIRDLLSPTFYEAENLTYALEQVFRQIEDRVTLRRVQFFDGDGKRRFWNIDVYALDDSPKRNQIVVNIDDITSQIRLEDDFVTLKELNENIVQNIPSGILVLDLEGRIVLSNKAAQGILGLNGTALEGRLHQDIFQQRVDMPQDNESWDYKTLVGRNTLSLELEVGRKATIGYSLSTMTDRGGKLKGTIVIFQDLTEILMLKNRLVHSEKMAGIGTLASGIAHEFNNLIGGMMGYAQLAAATGELDDYKKAVDIVFTSSKRAKEIISNLLTFSRRTHHEKEVISVNDMFKQVFKLVERDLQKANIQVDYDVDPNQKIKTDIGQVQQVLMNLIINAKHAMPDGGRLSLYSLEKDGEIHLCVEDNGVGIAEENINRIFEPFFTTKGSIGGGTQEGTGLGLSLSYGLIKDLGGEIRVESTENRGSVFTVALPSFNEGDEVDSRGNGKSKERQTKNKTDNSEYKPIKILVVDDDYTTLDLMYQVLTRQGNEVLTAPTGFMAIELARKNDFDLMFIDAVMPGIDGVETLGELRDTQPDAKAVVITGAMGNHLDRLKEQLSSLNAVIQPKPFEIPDILDYVRVKREAEKGMARLEE